MEKLKLSFIGNPVLRETAAPVPVVDDSIRGMLGQMEKIMRAESGAGLAAPQVGKPVRALVFIELKKRGEAGTVHKIINPKIIRASEKKCRMEEGCLSIQGTDGPVFADVERPESVEVEYLDEHGQKHAREWSGFAARAVLHEIDHLDGILFIDHLSSAKREMIMRKVKKAAKK
ncbi:MAG: peptide deformylase [Rickettsiales bacterium]|jgi:peptide deformylase|nr:peptide deformylase [Rickettsiales bacterium]